MTKAEKDAMTEDRGERCGNIGDAEKIWMGADGESSGVARTPVATKRRVSRKNRQ